LPCSVTQEREEMYEDISPRVYQNRDLLEQYYEQKRTMFAYNEHIQEQAEA
jgi:hypothetical protein